MPLLLSITANSIWLRCTCGHYQTIHVGDVIEGREDWNVRRVVEAARCIGCGARGQIEAVRIITVGGSNEAMRGAQTPER